MGIVYLVQPAELVGTSRYKIGCSTKSSLDRIHSGYNLGTRYLCIIKSDVPYELENKIKSEFNDKFTLISGRETFEGDEHKVINIFLKIVSHEYVLDDGKDDDDKEAEDSNELSEDEDNKTNFKCDNCNKYFRRKQNLEYHNSKNACKKRTKQCKYCKKLFTTSNSMYRHTKHSCKIKKQLLIENKQQDNKTKPADNKIKPEDNKIKPEDNKTKPEDNKIKPVDNKTNQQDNKTNQQDNKTKLVKYGEEDMTVLNDQIILDILKKGNDSILDLIEKLHFNPKYPEYHNIYITNMRDNYAYKYNGDEWKLTIKKDRIDCIYNDKIDYIRENINRYTHLLTDKQITNLNNLINADIGIKKIKKIKEHIKLLLYNSKSIPVVMRKHKR